MTEEERQAAYDEGYDAGVLQGEALERAATEARMAEAASRLSDGAAYRVARMLSAEERHPCPAETCRLNAEEHHLLAYGILAENKELRRRLEELEHGPKGDRE